MLKFTATSFISHSQAISNLPQEDFDNCKTKGWVPSPQFGYYRQERLTELSSITALQTLPLPRLFARLMNQAFNPHDLLHALLPWCSFQHNGFGYSSVLILSCLFIIPRIITAF